MTDLATTADYRAFLADLEDRVRRAQLSASLAVNRELPVLYWSIRRDRPGDGIMKRLVSRLPWGHDIRVVPTVEASA